jgi:hypothetical protein
MTTKWLDRLRSKDKNSSEHAVPKVPKAHSVTFGTPSGEDFQNLAVPYQRIWFDWDVPDGEYTPEQLRQAKKRVHRWGGVRRYTIRRAQQ